jgi:hypothetical protein
MSYIIKIKNKTFELVTGDEIMDNGFCYQLITRKVQKNFNWITPRISKKEFEKFIKLPNLHRIKRKYPSGIVVTIYQYREE